MAVSFTIPLQNAFWINSEENYENWSIFAKVIVEIKVVYFLSETQCKSSITYRIRATTQHWTIYNKQWFTDKHITQIIYYDYFRHVLIILVIKYY